jgi:hypothetical protein
MRAGEADAKCSMMHASATSFNGMVPAVFNGMVPAVLPPLNVLRGSQRRKCAGFDQPVPEHAYRLVDDYPFPLGLSIASHRLPRPDIP